MYSATRDLVRATTLQMSLRLPAPPIAIIASAPVHCIMV